MIQIDDIDFVNTDVTKVKQDTISKYEEFTGITLSRADPTRLFIEALCYIIVELLEMLNYAAKMNLLYYSRGKFLDHIGVLVGCYRLRAAPATTKLKITLSAPRPKSVLVPKGTRVAAEDNVIFETSSDVAFPAGITELEVAAECIEVGSIGNGFNIGEISRIVDLIAYVESMTNITVSEGGADEEDDEAFRQRIHEEPESFAYGTRESYINHTKEVSPLIKDVSVTSPEPGHVYIQPLLLSGEIPGDEILNAVREKFKSSPPRGFTDMVTVATPEITHYDINLVYYVDREDATRVLAIQQAVEKAVNDFAVWQKSKLGRDINRTELYYRVRSAGAKRCTITSPAEHQEINNDAVAVADSITVTFGGLEDG